VNPARVTGIVLAGGRSTRFGEDKLVAEVGGRPLLHLAIDVVATVVDEVVVVVGADAPAPLLPAGLRVPVVVARDAVADQGPLTGLAAGLAVASHSLALLVGGDQPALQPVLLRELLHRVGTGAADPPVDVIGLEDDGQLRGSPPWDPQRRRRGRPGRAALWACSPGSESRRWRRRNGASSTPGASRCSTSTTATTCRRPDRRR
jgi:CTP:molybdopterin cytidylyltransferase MocA